MYKSKKIPSSKVINIIEQINKYMGLHHRKRHSKEVREAYNHGEWIKELNRFEQTYIEHGDRVHLISGDKFQLDKIAGIENQTMKDLYKDFFGKDSDIRKELYAIFPESCPICDGPWGYIESHLDHILPESIFSQYAITPVNLVRTCSRCNHQKLTNIGLDENNQVINPYFKAIDFTDKLSCKVNIEANEFIANVFLKSNSILKVDVIEYEIITKFLERYKLIEVYTEVLEVHLLPELIKLFASRIYIRPSQSDFKEVLIEQRNSINTDWINFEKKVTTYFLKYLLLTSLIEDYSEDIYKVFFDKVEAKRAELYG